jgi:hypothetical protein
MKPVPGAVVPGEARIPERKEKKFKALFRERRSSCVVA